MGPPTHNGSSLSIGFVQRKATGETNCDRRPLPAALVPLARDDDVLLAFRRQRSFAKVALVRQMARSVGMMIIFGWWGREMSHVGLDQILTQGGVETDALKRNKDLASTRTSTSFGTGGRRFKSCHSDQYLSEFQIALI
jgi:hypothetical protein